jgi:hypothetical protein
MPHVAAQGPNFFIIGAPKCGTTALHHYLSQHPQIYMSELKEPHYYCRDFDRYSDFTEEDYQALFRAARPEHRYVGESSVYYLYSQVAVPLLLAEHPDARLVVMLRNPLELAPALHAQHLTGLAEDTEDFGQAWRKQAERARGEMVPPQCREARTLLYRDVGLLGEQLARVRQIVPAGQLHTIVFDDFKRNPAEAYAGVLEFLELPHDGRTEFPAVNTNTKLRSAWFRQLINERRVPAIVRRWGRACGLHRAHALLRRWSEVPAQRGALAPELRREMADAFRDDVGLLSELIERNLSHWLAV